MTIDKLMQLNDWESGLRQRNIIIQSDGEYVLLKYDINADFSDLVVQQCRGIIFKRCDSGYQCVCRPFYKFFNWQEGNAAHIDWSTARVQEKLDGSLMKLWYDDGGWKLSTNGTIDAYKAHANDFITFGELFCKADNYNSIQWNKMDTNCTYMFELVSPYNQVVIKYNSPHIYHIGTRNINGEEFDTDIGVEKPMSYELNSLKDCVYAAEAMNADSLAQEGFVVVDGQWQRIKIKSPKYVMYHRMWNNASMTAERIIELIRSGEVVSVMREFPLMREVILKWIYLLAEFRYDAEVSIRRARQLYEEFDGDRKATAFEINKMKYPFIGFWALDNEGDSDELLKRQTNKRLANVIEQKQAKR